MKKIHLYALMAASITFAMPSFASGYAGISHVVTKDQVVSDFKINSTKIFVGEDINEYLSIEMGLSNIGSSSNDAYVYIDEDHHGNLKVEIAHMIDFTVKPRFPISENVEAYSKVGFTNTKFRGNSYGRTTEYVTHNGLHAGIGFSLQPTPRSGFKLFAEMDALPGLDLNRYNVGLRTTF